ncbi:MAG: FKBP-type peptidyl-prolyl cis-trans isomerase [Alphaproteobacteria bacterium]
MFLKKPKYEREPTPPWLMWVFIGFFIFAFLNYNREGTEEDPNTLKQAIDKASSDLRPSNFFNYDHYKEKVFPNFMSRMRYDDLNLGSGLPAVCGQNATIRYSAWLDENTKIEATEGDDTYSFIIGEGSAMPVFDQSVIGMQPGGKRKVFAPMAMSYGLENFKREELPPQGVVQFSVELLELSPPLPDPDKAPYRIAVTRTGSGAERICGEEVRTHLTVWDMEGRQIFSTIGVESKPLAFRLGKSEVFVGLEQGTVGMKPGELRTLVVPPSFQKPLREAQQIMQFPFPKDQTILVDVELLP